MKNLNLFGVVLPYEDCINAASVQSFLEDLKDGEEFTVYINSPGGSVFEGIAIYNLLSAYQSRMTIKIIGEAASIASVIACSGAEGKTLIAETAMMLIHNPWTFAIVDEEYIAKLAKTLGSIKGSILTAYKRKTGLDDDTLNDLMKDGDYLSAKDSVKHGLADAVYVPSEEEQKETEASNQIVQDLLRKHVIMNLNLEQKNNTNLPQNQGEFTMFKNIEEATLEYGKLQNKLDSVDTQLKAATDSVSQLNETVKLRDADLLNLRSQLTETEQKLTDSASVILQLTEANYLNEAKLFCEDMFAKGKLTRAEINGNADLTKGEVPAKIAKLVALKKKDKELWQMEIDEIQSKTTVDVDALKQNLPFAATPGNLLSDMDKLMDSAINQLNDGRK